MPAIDLDTILLPDDIANQVGLHCLSCRRRLGAVAYVERRTSNAARQIAVSVSLHAGVLRDFRQGLEQIILVCACGQKSTFHLL